MAISLGIALLAGLLLAPGPPRDEDLLGRLDDLTGRSSAQAPAADLQLLWRRPVDELSTAPDGPPRLVALGQHVVVDDVVVAVGEGDDRTPPVHLPLDAVPAPDGTVLLADGEVVVTVDAATGTVRSRRPLAGAWRPVGPSRGWVAGAAVLTDATGVPGAVERDGDVRWVGRPGWSWTAAGHGSDWAVVVAADVPRDRVLVVDGRDGSVHRDVGPVGVVHAPVVHDDTFAWVDPYSGLDRGLGHPVEVHGIRLDGSGRVWAVTDLPSTSGVPQAVRLAAGPSGLVVDYWTTGQATTATWLDPVDGSQVARVAVSGTGVTPEGWPVATVVGAGVAHVDPVRREIRVVDRSGVVQWALPAGSGEGVAAVGDAVLVRTPPRGTSLQSRVRLHDAATGRVVWDRVDDGTAAQRITGVLGEDVAVTADPGPAPITEQSWFDLDTGRRRSAAGIAADVLGGGTVDPSAPVLLGRIDDGGAVVPVVQLPDGRVVTGGEAVPSADLAARLGATPVAGAAASDLVRADDDLGIRVGAATVTAVGTSSGAQRWHRALPVPLRPDLTVLLSGVVVVVGWDGVVRALDRTDGSERWVGPAGVTAVTAGGDEVVLGTATGEVVVLAPTGAQLQRVRVGQDPVEDVAVVGGRVVATVGRDLVALGRGATVVEPRDRVEVP